MNRPSRQFLLTSNFKTGGNADNLLSNIQGYRKFRHCRQHKIHSVDICPILHAAFKNRLIELLVPGNEVLSTLGDQLRCALSTSGYRTPHQEYKKNKAHPSVSECRSDPRERRDHKALKLSIESRSSIAAVMRSIMVSDVSSVCIVAGICSEGQSVGVQFNSA